MGKAFASGNLSGTSENSARVDLQHVAVGAIGLLLTGTWGATGLVKPETYDIALSADRPLGYWGNTGNKLEYNYSAVGLYYANCHVDNLIFVLTGGEAGETDIDWTLFLKPRP